MDWQGKRWLWVVTWAAVALAASAVPVAAAVLFSDSFNRSAGVQCGDSNYYPPSVIPVSNYWLGAADNALSGTQTRYYIGIKGIGFCHVVGATLDANTVYNGSTSFGGGGFEVSNAASCCGSSAGVGQDLNVQAEILVPRQVNAAAVGTFVCGYDATTANLYVRSRIAATGDGVRGGSASGYRVELDSLGQVRIAPKNTTTPAVVSGALAFTARQASFDPDQFHTLLLSIAGSPGTMRVVLDGRLQVFAMAPEVGGGTTTAVPLLVVGGSNNGTTGVEFESDPRYHLAGQRVDDYVVADATAVLPCSSGACDDGNPCTTNDLCSGGACSGTPIDCSHLDDACTLGVCDASSGACTAVPLRNGLTCDDGLIGTTGDTCSCGVCLGTCADDADCSDGDACNGSETCVSGRCVSGTPVDCPASDDCHSGVCNPTDGACSEVAKADGSSCDDADACTVVDECTGGVCAGTLEVAACLDHFLCYKVGVGKAERGQPAYTEFSEVTSLEVVDAYSGALPDQHLLDLAVGGVLCNPANKNDEDPTAPAHLEHLRGYKAKLSKTDPKQPQPAARVVSVDNQFGSLQLKLSKVLQVRVPSTKVLGDAGAPALGVPTTKHFKCYKAAVAKAPRGVPAYPEFTPQNVELEDQFGAASYTLSKVSSLCVPANKAGEDPSALTHPANLVCYRAKLRKLDPLQDKFVSTRVSTNNQFGPEVLDAKSVVELCVPSLRTD